MSIVHKDMKNLMEEITAIEKKEIYCSNCKVVQLPPGYVELCHGCITEIVEWLAWDQYASQLNREYELEQKALEHSYQSQFSL